jgi:hypothetical protein
VLTDTNQIPDLDEKSVRYLDAAFRDGSLTPQDQPELADMLFDGWAAQFRQRRGPAVRGIVKMAGPAFEWLSLVMQGQLDIRQAWAARGGGWADSVTEEGWKKWGQELTEARAALTKAWELRPDLPHAATLMIEVAMGQSGNEQMNLWFERATKAQIDNASAWGKMRWGLRPRWHGTIEEMNALGVRAVDTGRFDTDVPRKYFDVVTDMESELKKFAGEHIYGRSDIWPNFQRVYEGYIAEPSQAYARDGWRSSFAGIAYFAGHYDVARKQLEALNWQPWPSSLYGWGTELSLMPLEVAARTGSAGPQITEGEASHSPANVGRCKDLYTALLKDSTIDDRTRQFLRHRLAALEVEDGLTTMNWVDFLPRQTNDLGWVEVFGSYQPVEDGVVEVKCTPYGHFIYCRARVGYGFEMRGEMEVVRSSTSDFQAGVIMGLPEYYQPEWYGFRIIRDHEHGNMALFDRTYTTPQLGTPLTVTERNTFDLVVRSEKVTATVNGQKVFDNAPFPAPIHVHKRNYLLGLGGRGNGGEMIVRYRNLQIRRL